MSPDPTTTPQDTAKTEARLRRFALPEPPAVLDARVGALLAGADAAETEALLRKFALPAVPSALDARVLDALAAAPVEAALLGFALPEPSSALDARMAALLGASPGAATEAPGQAPAILASHPSRAFWRNAALKRIVAAAAALAACATLAVLLRPAAPVALVHAPGTNHPESAPAVAKAGDAPADDVMTGVSNAAYPSPANTQVVNYAVPAGYEYQGSRTVYTRETPVGTITDSGAPMRAIRRDTLERHLYCNPKTQETLEVDTPREDLLLENMTSY